MIQASGERSSSCLHVGGLRSPGEAAAQGCEILHLVIVHLKEQVLAWDRVFFPVRGVGTVVPPACCNLFVYGHLHVAPLQLFRQQAALRLEIPRARLALLDPHVIPHDHLHYREILRIPHQFSATMHVKNRPGGVAQKLEAQSVEDIVAEDICLPRVVVEDVLPVFCCVPWRTRSARHEQARLQQPRTKHSGIITKHKFLGKAHSDSTASSAVILACPQPGVVI